MEPKDLLLHVLAELREPMEQAVAQHCDQYTRDIESHAVSMVMSSHEEQQAKVIHLKEGDIWFAEYGCTICDLGPPGFKLTDCVKGTTGSGVQIDLKDCQAERGIDVGTFHTHPYGGAAPSVGDLMNVFTDNRTLNFIGGVVGGRKVIMGYSPRPDSIMRWELKQKVEPYESAHTRMSEYLVHFVFRMPGATSAEDLSIQRYNVLTEEKQLINFTDDINWLKSVFDVIVHWF